jgi:hypothetical protein
VTTQEESSSEAGSPKSFPENYRKGNFFQNSKTCRVDETSTLNHAAFMTVIV